MQTPNFRATAHYLSTRLPTALLLALASAAPAAAADHAQAKAIVSTSCVACHGEDGNSVVPMFPKLAGLQTEYLTKQLNEFISGKRKNDIMAPIVAALKPGDVGPLAAYFSGQKMTPGSIGDKALADAGRSVFMDGNEDTGVPACAGCHQSDGLGRASGGSDIARFPRLAGQNAEYLANQLRGFKEGARANDPARIMRAVAKRMTEQEIKAVAEFISGGL